MHPRLAAFSLAVSVWAVLWTPSIDAQMPESRMLDCDSTFRATDDPASLAARFGAAAVAKGEISLGEGFSEVGTILFGESERDRVEILWRDVSGQRGPRSVRIRGQNSNWRTPTGVSLGDDLRRIERLNGRPFRLAGFGWDYSGTQLTWAGGRLEGSSARSCSTRVRMRPDQTTDTQGWYRQVIGDREFSSGHDAMQALNPRIYEIWLDFADVNG